MAAVSPGLRGAAPTHTTVLIARLARVVRQRFEQAFVPLGLRQRDIVALSYLRGHGPTAQQAFAERLCLDASSTVCLLNALEDAGFVERHRDRSDRRRALVDLSPAGERVLEEVDRVVARVEEDLLSGLERDERTVLQGLLSRLDPGEPDWAAIADDAG